MCAPVGPFQSSDLPKDLIDGLQALINSVMTSVFLETIYSTVHAKELVRQGWRTKDNPIQEADLDEGVLGKHVDCVGASILLKARITDAISSVFNDGTCHFVILLKFLTVDHETMYKILNSIFFIQLRRRNKQSSDGFDEPSHVALALYLPSGVILMDLGKFVVCQYLKNGDSCSSADRLRFTPSSFTGSGIA